MVLYNQLIRQIKDLLPPCEKRFSYKKVSLKQGDKNAILLLKDTAYELGGSQKPCISTMAVTSSMQFDNSICLYGKEIDEETAFDRIKELELIKYNCSPDGFMTRASALSMREQIRVSKKAVKKGITFADYGSVLLQEYLKNPIVKSAQIIFITQFEKFDELLMLADKIKSTTSALNHILDNVIFDCSTCNLKEICNEVEGMKELHIKKAKQ